MLYHYGFTHGFYRRKMSVSAYFTLLTLILGLWWGRLYKGDRWGMDDGWGICQQHIHPVSNSNGIQMQIWEGCLGFEYIDCITLCWIHVPFGIYFVCLSISFVENCWAYVCAWKIWWNSIYYVCISQWNTYIIMYIYIYIIYLSKIDGFLNP